MASAANKGRGYLTDETSGSRRDTAGEGGPILVAADFSPDSEAALVWACDYAGCVGADLVVLHVVHDPADAPGYYRKSEEDLLRPQEDVALGMMDRFLEKAAKKHAGLELLVGRRRSWSPVSRGPGSWRWPRRRARA